MTREMLQEKSLNDLREIARLQGVKALTKYRKSELVDIIMNGGKSAPTEEAEAAPRQEAGGAPGLRRKQPPPVPSRSGRLRPCASPLKKAAISPAILPRPISSGLLIPRIPIIIAGNIPSASTTPITTGAVTKAIRGGTSRDIPSRDTMAGTIGIMASRAISSRAMCRRLCPGLP